MKKTLEFSKEIVQTDTVGNTTKVSTEASLNKGRRAELDKSVQSLHRLLDSLFQIYPVEGVAKRAEEDKNNPNLGKSIAALKYRVNAQRRFSKLAYDASSVASELSSLLEALGEDCAVKCIDALAEARRLSE